MLDLNKNIKFSFRPLVGSLMYLRFTRTDLLYSLHKLSWFNQKFDSVDIKAIVHLLGYLKRTRLQEKKFHYFENTRFHLVAFTDADWATNTVDRKSVSGHFIYLGSSSITARVRKQKRVMLSSTGSELNEICKTTNKLQYILGLLKEIKIDVKRPCVLFTRGHNKAVGKISQQNKVLGNEFRPQEI